MRPVYVLFWLLLTVGAVVVFASVGLLSEGGGPVPERRPVPVLSVPYPWDR